MKKDQLYSVPTLIRAVTLLDRYLTDLETSNPGYLGKLTLQDYATFNQAMVARYEAVQMIKKGGVS